MKNNFDGMRSRLHGSSLIIPQIVNARETREEQVKRKRRRESRLSVEINGKFVNVKVQKRPYTGFCELCNSKQKNLSYHHWDDMNLSKGLWLCPECHRFAEFIDRHLRTIDRYMKVKRRANNQAFSYTPVRVVESDTPLIDTLLSYLLVGEKDKSRRVEV